MSIFSIFFLINGVKVEYFKQYYELPDYIVLNEIYLYIIMSFY
jgi:hypothetical protein